MAPSISDRHARGFVSLWTLVCGAVLLNLALAHFSHTLLSLRAGRALPIGLQRQALQVGVCDQMRALDDDADPEQAFEGMALTVFRQRADADDINLLRIEVRTHEHQPWGRPVTLWIESEGLTYAVRGVD